MTGVDMAYVVKTSKDLAAVCDDFKKGIQERGFRVLADYDVQAMLGEKGFQRGPMRIIEFCNARYAHIVLQGAEMISTLMPCRTTVYTSGGETVIASLKPTALAQFFPEADLKGIPEEVERIVCEVMDEAAR